VVLSIDCNLTGIIYYAHALIHRIFRSFKLLMINHEYANKQHKSEIKWMQLRLNITHILLFKRTVVNIFLWHPTKLMRPRSFIKKHCYRIWVTNIWTSTGLRYCERSVIGELWLAKLPNVRGRSLTQMLTERTTDLFDLALTIPYQYSAVFAVYK